MLQGKSGGDGEETWPRPDESCPVGDDGDEPLRSDTEQFNRHVLNSIPGEGGLNRDEAGYPG